MIVSLENTPSTYFSGYVRGTETTKTINSSQPNEGSSSTAMNNPSEGAMVFPALFDDLDDLVVDLEGILDRSQKTVYDREREFEVLRHLFFEKVLSSLEK